MSSLSPSWWAPYSSCSRNNEMLTWIEIDKSAVRINLETFHSILPAGTLLMAVVKANAYGHGLEVFAPLAAEHADWLGVNSLDEALEIRSLGIQKPVAILGYTELDHLDVVVANDFRQVVYRVDTAAGLSKFAQMRNLSARIHLKLETGTNRQGIPLDELPELVRQIRTMPGLIIEGAYTHFANIEDTLDPSFAERQLDKFREAIRILEQSGVRPAIIHAAATAGTLLYPETGFTMIRLGIGAYGIWPSRETQLAARERGRKITLTPVMTWKTRVAQIKTVEAGEHVSYGLTYEARHRMKVAVLPIGYYDGYDRKLSNCGRALIRGQAVPVIGRVAMNMTMLDVTDVPAETDDEVVLLGRQGNAEIRAEELAEKIGTIAYEVVSRINPRIPRIASG
jgi:alanine racemase